MIGDRVHRVTFENQTSTNSEYGKPVKTWATLASRWCKITQTGGKEGNVGERVTGTNSVELECDWSSELKTLSEQHRARWAIQGTTYVATITAVNHQAFRRNRTVISGAIVST